jgi:uncharacterized protein (DUF1501 family)
LDKTSASRRQFLSEASLLVSSYFALADLPWEQVLQKNGSLKFALERPRNVRHVVSLQLVGGNDWFNTILPLEQGIYQDFRGCLAGNHQQAFLMGEGLYLNRELATFAHLYEAGKLACVQGLGYDRPSFSHDLAQTIWHSGRTDLLREESWTGLPSLFFQVRQAASGLTSDLPDFVLCSHDQGQLSLSQLLAKLCASSVSLHLVLQIEGFDNHINLAGNHQQALKKLDAFLAVLLRSLEEEPLVKQNSLFLIYSEFGRRLALNGENGTEHGGGAFALLFGESVRGGLWGPQLNLARQVDSKGIYRAQLDFRSLYATTLSNWLDKDPVESLGRRYEALPLLESSFSC